MKEGRKPEFPEKTPGDELHKMPYTKARRFKPQARLEPAQQHCWQARKADVLAFTPRVAPIIKLVKPSHIVLLISLPTTKAILSFSLEASRLSTEICLICL